MQGFDNKEYSIKEFEIYHSDGKEYDPILCPTGIEEHSLKNEGIKVYPNPAMDKLTIEFDLALQEATTLKLIDSGGKVVHSEVITPGMRMVNIDLSTLREGLYLIQISTDKDNLVEKFVKY